MKHSFYILLLLIAGQSLAQDPQISQFYANQLYTNPAFTGNTNTGRFMLNHRNQWSKVSGKFATTSFAYDHNLFKKNSGLGVFIMRDNSGTGPLNFTDFGLSYAYNLKINRELSARFGVKIDAHQWSTDPNKYVFSDQINRGGNVNTVETFTSNRITYFDSSLGTLVFGKDWWFGISPKHVNQPTYSFMGENARLPMKLSLHGGKKFSPKGYRTVESNESITLAFHYKTQKEFDQLDIGVYYENKPVIIGIWYRGLQAFKAYSPGYSNNDAFIFLAGLKLEKFSFGYSYDFTVSNLFGQTSGSHEISLVFEYETYQNRRNRYRSVACPKF